MSLDANAVALPLLNALRRSLERISVITSHRHVFQDFLTCVGWDVPISDTDLQSIRNFINVEAPLEALGDIADRIESRTGDPTKLAGEMLASIASLIGTIKAWSSGNLASLPAPFNGTTDFWTNFPEDMLNHLIAQSLDAEAPNVSRVLVLFGILDKQIIHPPGQQRVFFVRQLVHWDKLGALVTDPIGALRNSFNWNQAGSDFDYIKFLYSLGLFVESAGFTGRLSNPPSSLLDIYYAAGNPTRGKVKELNIPFLLEVGDNFSSFAEIGLQVLPITPAGNLDGKPTGFAVLPLVQGSVKGRSDPNAEWSLAVTGDSMFDGMFRLEVRPDGAGLVLAPGLTALNLGISLQGHFQKPRILVGAENSHRVEVEGVRLGVEIKGVPGDPDVILKIGTGEGSGAGRLRFILQAGEGDGFIQQLLGSRPQSIDLSGYLSISQKNGLGINGSIGVQIQIPLHISLGSLELQTLQLATGPNASGGVDIPIGLNIRAALGPLTVVVEDIGVAMQLTALHTNERAGLLGNLDVDWKFKPPKGVGLSLDAGIIKGGGFLYIDPDRGEYAGALELVFAEFLNLHAVGLISTKMPDGSNGFSLLIIITADFGPGGIQLGFGFTLLAVGGLLGLNRSMLLQPLLDGVRTGSIESIMFPHDVIANAPRIISDLRAIFPPHEGTFLIGPLAKVGWGEPTLVSLSLGVIIEIPPGDIAILGILKVALPAEELPILVLQVNFSGVFEFDKQRLYFFASLFDSHILFITIEGEMGVLFAYGNDANFVLSVGGFHPQFNPPPLPFPTPRRIQVNIINESYARIRCDGYFAVTPNTVQFGSHSEYFFGFSALSVEGHSGFDVLIQRSPFHFIAEISTSFSVKVFGLGVYGIGIDLSLSGPGEWHAHGTASISFLFFSIGIGIDFTWGESRDTTLPPIAVMPILTAEFGKQSNWRAILPSGSNLLVSLRQLDPTEAAFVLHPVGTLRVSQRVIPLDLTLDKVGNQKPTDANRFTLSVTSGGLAKKNDSSELFPPSEFKNFDDAARLSQPAYQPQHGGIELSAAGNVYASATAITREVRYHLTIIDTTLQRHRFFSFLGSLFTHLLGGASVTRNAFSAYRQSQMQPFAEKITVASETFAVAHQADNTVYHPEAAAFTSQASANDYLTHEVARNPTLAESLHVLSQFEVAA